MDFFSLSHALFLNVKTKTGSPFCSSHPWLPTCGRRGLPLDSWRWGVGGGGWVWTVELQCIMFKLKKKKIRYCRLGQQFALCGVSSQPITWHLYVTILWFILLRPISTQHGGRGALACGKCRSSGYKHWSFCSAGPILLCGSVEKKKQEIQNRTWHLCIWETFVEILILFIQRMFCNGKKKNYTYGNSLRIGVGQQKIVLFSFFSVLIVIVNACLFREGDNVCHSFWNGKKETCCLTKKDLWFRPSAFKNVMLTLYATGMSGLSCALRGYVGL